MLNLNFLIASFILFSFSYNSITTKNDIPVITINCFMNSLSINIKLAKQKENHSQGIMHTQPEPNKPYSKIKNEIRIIRTKIDTNKITQDSLSNLFTHLLVRNIIPYWYGTMWSFEGHTSIPGKGEIACGYFVSTTLRDMGINLNRYKLAQQLPVNEAKSISSGEALIEISDSTTEGIILKMHNKLQNGIYFLGFDQSHVGYLYKKEKEILLLHSNFINYEGVIVEKAEESEVFSYFNHFYIAKISSNKNLLRKWISNQEIEIFTN